MLCQAENDLKWRQESVKPLLVDLLVLFFAVDYCLFEGRARNFWGRMGLLQKRGAEKGPERSGCRHSAKHPSGLSMQKGEKSKEKEENL